MKHSRLYEVLYTFKAYHLGELIPKGGWLSWWIRLAMTLLFWIRKQAKDKSIGERLCLAFQELGPVWIKFGQMLSTRNDLLPGHITKALCRLQDQVKPFDGQVAINIIEAALGTSLDSYFDDFEVQPVASASIAQVHVARLKKSKMPIIIKVLRPGITEVIKADIRLMYSIARKLTKWVNGGERFKAYDIVHDYEITILKELNFLQEARNARRLRDNFIDSHLLYIPYVYHELCRKNILIQERIYGVPIAHMDKLNSASVDLKCLAEKGVETFFTQVFRDNFFHADMHPGNIFVDISDVTNPRYIGVDCAIVGELTSDDQSYLAENFIAFFNRDYRKIAQLYIDFGWVSTETNVYRLEMAMRDICEPIFAKPLGEISFARILFNLFSVARQFNMVVQPQLILLEKTLFYIEGLGRQLYPELDLWKTAKPFLENWYAQRMDIKNIFFRTVKIWPHFCQLLPDLPTKIVSQERDRRLLKNKLENMTGELTVLKKRNTRYFLLLFIFIIVDLVVR